MTLERAFELSVRSRSIAEQLKHEVSIANAANDTKRINYIKQELIVLKRMAEILACITFAQNNNDED